MCSAIALARLAELAWSRRNIARTANAPGGRQEGEWSHRTYPLIVAVHALDIVSTAIWGVARPRRPWLVLLLAVQPLRAWVLMTLGTRWNTRAAVDSQMEIATAGPYTYIRHPNYLVVAVELLALPMAFGLRAFAIAISLANAGLLALRIRDEEALLEAVPGWEEHFRTKKRFIPGLW